MDPAIRASLPSSPRTSMSARTAVGVGAGTLVAAWAAAMVVNRSLRRVEGPSMLPGLVPNDLLLTRPRAPGNDRDLPRRGDLVVAGLDGVGAIKRVVGLPGDTVVLGDGHLHVDGSWWEIPGAVLVDEDLRMEVGANRIAVMGDNRRRSTDSRTTGPIPLTDVQRLVVRSARPWRRVGAGVGMRRTIGPRRREAVRVIVVDPDDRVLLFRVRDKDGGDDQWWETPGGGLQPGESIATTAAREVHEEVGAPHGPIVSLDHVATRTSTYWGTDILRVEHTMAARVSSAEVVTDNWTPGEIADHVDWQWCSPAQVAALTDPIHPHELPTLLAQALRLV